MDMDYTLEPGYIRIFRTRKHHPVSDLAVKLVGKTHFGAIIIDGSATIDPYYMVRVCKKYDFDEREVLGKILVARGFTAYQMRDLVNKTEDVVIQTDSRFLGIICLGERFADDHLGIEEGTWLRSRTVKRIRELVLEYRLYCAVADIEPKIFTKRCGGETRGKECPNVQAGTGQDRIGMG